MWELAVPVAIAVIVVLVIGLLLAKLYRRSTRDEAYVRTGLGGQKVVLDGGSIVLPVFHSVASVNLKTLRLEVARERGVPPYVIFHDATLREMARLRPTSVSELLHVKGIGARKAEDLGDLFLDVIRRSA